METMVLLPDPQSFRMFLPVFEKFIPMLLSLSACKYRVYVGISECLAEYYMDASDEGVVVSKEMNSHERKRMLGLMEKYPRQVFPIPLFYENQDGILIDYASMSVSERCLLGIRQAADSFCEYLGDNVKIIVPFDPNNENCSSYFMQMQNINSCNFEEILGILFEREDQSYLDLMQKVHECRENYDTMICLGCKAEEKQCDDEEDWTKASVEKGLADGILVRGTLEVTKENLKFKILSLKNLN